MTSLTFANFFTFIYGWIGIWCLLAFLLMISRRGKGWSDYDVILFRFAVGGTTLAVFINRMWNPQASVSEPVVTAFLWAMVIFHIILGYASAATTIRIGIILWEERKVRRLRKKTGHIDIIESLPDDRLGQRVKQQIVETIDES